MKPVSVSCIMPTGYRPNFVLKSIEYFFAQDYPEKELVILADKPLDIPPHPQIKCCYKTSGKSIGEKRNRGVEISEGRIIIQWDDDDYFGDSRISRQVDDLILSRSHINAYELNGIFHINRWRIWKCKAHIQERCNFPVYKGAHSCTNAYWRDIWEKGVKYKRSSMGEDLAFLKNAIRHGCTFSKCKNNNDFLYVRHGTNTWQRMKQLRQPELNDISNWSMFSPEHFIAPDHLAFYETIFSPNHI